MTVRGITSRIDRLRKQQQMTARRATDPSWYEFLVSPSCPPTTTLYIRGGFAYAEKSDFGQDWSGLGWTIPSLQRDVADEDDLVSTEFTFDTANYYHYYILLLALPQDNLDEPEPSDWKLRLRGWSDADAAAQGLTREVETAGEAEEALLTYLYEGGIDVDDVAWPWGDGTYAPTGMPLCGLILKNDGRTGNGAYFLPIDRVNRGRSYIWPKDLRPRWMDK